MKTFAVALLLLAPATLFAADKPNPTDFPIKVHVVSSHQRNTYDGTVDLTQQVINVTIEGVSYELTGVSDGVLALGDYPAQISTKVHGPRNPNSYDIYKGYDFLMPDGNVRTYAISGIGPAAASAN